VAQSSGSAVLRVNLLLAALGAVVGILASIPLTWIGKLLAGAPDPATAANYLWNMQAFGIMGALFGPILAWSTLRRVPLWRAALEPAAGAIVGATLGMMLGSAVLLLFLAACGITLTAWRLNHAYRESASLKSGGRDRPSRLQP
jgi:hypothetical protein